MGIHEKKFEEVTRSSKETLSKSIHGKSGPSKHN